jgi:hypothetical protein
MNTRKDVSMTTTTITEPAAKAAEEPGSKTAETKIHWAGAPTQTSKDELERKFEAMRARNWITERMVEQYQKHWHCSREAALERLLAKAGA